MYRELGIDDWDEQTDPVHDRLFALEDQIAETPARSIAGIAVKLRICMFRDGDDIDLVRAALRDAERLAGEASS